MIKDFTLLHVAFAVVCVLVLLLPLGVPVGLRLLGLVLLYNVSLPVVTHIRGHKEWLDLWLFLVPLSALQLFPDWFLATELGVIVFPNAGAPTVGPIPVFMAGMWVIPLFIIIWLGQQIELRKGKTLAHTAVAVLSGSIFVGSEATLWRIPIWWAQGVTTVGHVAVYLVIPEVLLGLSAYWAYHWSKTRSVWERLWAAFVVMLIYIGGLSFFYLIVENVLLE